jgi:hypothetical protein
MRRPLVLALCCLALCGTMVARAAAGTVEGTVLPLSAAQEVEVCVAKNPPGELCAVPKADGSYVFSGLEGPTKIEFVPTYRSRMLTQFYDHKSTLAEAELIGVPGVGSVKGIDADLIEGGTITGTVTAASTGDPLSEVEVCAVSAVSPSLKSCDQTGAGGGYELHSLPTGYYKVGFHGRGMSAGYAPWYFDGKSVLAQAAPILVTAGAATTIEPGLVKGAQVSGAVTAAASGAVLEGTPVCLFVSGASAADRCTESGPGGMYSFEGLPEGLYQVGFALGGAEIGGGGAGSGPGGYLPQFYDRVASRAEAQTLPLSGAQVDTGVDAALVTPTVSTPILPAPPASNVVAALPTISEPAQPKPRRCKKGFVRKKVKGAEKCVKGNTRKRQKKKGRSKHKKAKPKKKV